MHRDPINRQLTALAMAAVMTFTALPLGSLQAGMISTKEIIEQEHAQSTIEAPRTEPRQRVQDFLLRDDVRAEMIALGITPSEAEARVAAMTEEEIASLAGRLDQLPAGGAGIATVLVFIFVAFGIAVMLDALGMMNIFPFVCSGGECGGQVQNVYQEQPAAGPVEDYRYEERRPAYRGDPYDRQGAPPAYDPNNPYGDLPQAPRQRNYFEERSGHQRYVR